MANIFLNQNIKNYLLANDGDYIYGTHGSDGESVTIQNKQNSDFSYTQTKNLTIDSNIEVVNLQGAFSDYTLKQNGNILKVYDSNNNLISSIGIDDDGSIVSFAGVDYDVSLQSSATGFDMYVGDTNLNSASGVVSDGYIAYATVFADLNSNGILDEDEPQTLTDANGNFSLQGVGGASLISKGGVDISTGLAFEGSFSAPSGSTTISPITTLVDSMVKNNSLSVEQANEKVATALGIDNSIDLKTFDPIAVGNNSALSAELQAQAVAIQTVAVQIANILSQTAAAVSGAGVADSLSSTAAAADALAAAISDSTESFDLADSTNLSNIVSSAATKAMDNSTLTQEEKTAATEKIDAVKEKVANATATINTAMNTEASAEGSTASDIFNNLAKVQVAADDVKADISTAASGDETASANLDSVSNESISTAAAAVTPEEIAAAFETSVSENTSVDIVAPTMGVSIIGDIARVNLSEYIDRTNLPDVSAFSLKDGSDNVIEISGFGTIGMNFIDLKLATIPLNTQTISLTYTDPSENNDTNALQDEAGNDVITTTKTGIIPSTTPSADDNINPEVSYITFTDANSISFNFSENMNGYASDYWDIKVLDSSENVLTHSSASHGGSYLNFELNSEVSLGDTITISYVNDDEKGIYDLNEDFNELQDFKATYEINEYGANPIYAASLELSALSADGKTFSDILGNVIDLTITASDEAQTLNIQGSGTNSITAGLGADIINLGSGTDTVVINYNTAVVDGNTVYTQSDSNSSGWDIISNFDVVNDKLDLGFGSTVKADGTVDSLTISNGIATKDGDITVGEIMTALGNTNDAVAYFAASSNINDDASITSLYIIQADGDIGTSSADDIKDIMVELVGITAEDLTDLSTILI